MLCKTPVLVIMFSFSGKNQVDTPFNLILMVIGKSRMSVAFLVNQRRNKSPRESLYLTQFIFSIHLFFVTINNRHSITYFTYSVHVSCKLLCCVCSINSNVLTVEWVN